MEGECITLLNWNYNCDKYSTINKDGGIRHWRRKFQSTVNSTTQNEILHPSQWWLLPDRLRPINFYVTLWIVRPSLSGFVSAVIVIYVSMIFISSTAQTVPFSALDLSIIGVSPTAVISQIGSTVYSMDVPTISCQAFRVVVLQQTAVDKFPLFWWWAISPRSLHSILLHYVQIELGEIVENGRCRFFFRDVVFSDSIKVPPNFKTDRLFLLFSSLLRFAAGSGWETSVIFTSSSIALTIDMKHIGKTTNKSSNKTPTKFEIEICWSRILLCINQKKTNHIFFYYGQHVKRSEKMKLVQTYFERVCRKTIASAVSARTTVGLWWSYIYP